MPRKEWYNLNRLRNAIQVGNSLIVPVVVVAIDITPWITMDDSLIYKYEGHTKVLVELTSKATQWLSLRRYLSYHSMWVASRIL